MSESNVAGLIDVYVKREYAEMKKHYALVKLNNTTLVQDHDSVIIYYGAQPMCDGENRAISELAIERIL